MDERKYRFSILYQCIQSNIGNEPNVPTIHPPEYYLLRYRSIRSVPTTKGSTVTPELPPDTPLRR